MKVLIGLFFQAHPRERFTFDICTGNSLKNRDEGFFFGGLEKPLEKKTRKETRRTPTDPLRTPAESQKKKSQFPDERRNSTEPSPVMSAMKVRVWGSKNLPGPFRTISFDVNTPSMALLQKALVCKSTCTCMRSRSRGAIKYRPPTGHFTIDLQISLTIV